LKVLLTHTPQARRQYYGERSLDGLQALGQVKLHKGDDVLDAKGLNEAASVNADRWTHQP
jgi:D-3-phosphoglycerate dehydrogenase